MIGQKIIQNRIKGEIENDKFPRYSIILGQRGSGKKLLTNEIAHWLGATKIVSGNKADEVRDVVNMSYKMDTKVLCVFADVQTMSTIAQNVMLKITEEPPNNVYFIMTAENESQLLPTLLSRGTTYRMDMYTRADLIEYLDSTRNMAEHENYEAFLLDLCETPYELDYILDYGEVSFANYINLVVDNIAEVSGANAFKIGARIALGGKEDESDKIDLVLFWKGFIRACMTHICDDIKYVWGIKITTKYLQDLRITGINKQMCFDNWLLDIRKEWM